MNRRNFFKTIGFLGAAAVIPDIKGILPAPAPGDAIPGDNVPVEIQINDALYFSGKFISCQGISPSEIVRWSGVWRAL